MVRVVKMNESSAEDIDTIPLPAKQQLGIFDPRVDVDARSGNGLRDRVGMEDSGGVGYEEPDPNSSGANLLPVTYHLGHTVELHQTAETNAGATTVRQGDGDQEVTTQREVMGPNERQANELGAKNPESAGVSADSGAAARSEVVTTTPGGPSSGEGSTAKHDEVPDGSIQTVLKWVGDDKDRARRAIEKENGRSDPRSSLLAQLNEKI